MIDTHCHLNLTDKFKNPAETIQRCLDQGVHEVIVIGIDLVTSRKAVELAEQFPNVYATIGYHPTSCKGFNESWLRDLDPLTSSDRVVGYGEIGLDYYWDTVSPEEQAVALSAQWNYARSLGLPVVFHSREAYPAMLDFLEKADRHPFVFHCFAGNLADAKRATALDAYFGVNGPITYKKADDLRAVVKSLPRDRVLIETDSPFLSPEPFRGKPNEPCFVEYVNAKLAELWNLPESQADQITTGNAHRFFKFPPSRKE